MFYKVFFQILFIVNTIFFSYANPEVSVIIPIYNTEKDFLIQCLDSVTKQTLSNIEIICVNDGSTNIDTINTIDDYAKKDQRITILNQDNQGISSARNKGLDIAQAKYVIFFDSDDYIHPQMLEIMTAMAKDVDVDVVICYYHKVGDVLSDFFKKYEVPKCDVIYDITRVIVWNGLCHQAWNKLYKKSAIGDLRFSDEAFSCEDIEFNYRLFCRNIKKYKIVDIPLYYYRVDNVSMIRSLFVNRKMDGLCYLINILWTEGDTVLPVETKHEIIRGAINYAINKCCTLTYSDIDIFLYCTQKINDLYSKGVINFNILEKASDKMKLAMFICIGNMQSAWEYIKNCFSREKRAI